jgi:large subunit ribosomal protein L9
MKIVLRQDYDKLGKLGDVVEVKNGFARNYLIPRNIAFQATPQNLKTFENDRKRAEQKQLHDQREAQQLADKLKDVSLTATVTVGEEDKVFGAITSQNIADLLAAKGFELDRRKIQLDEPLKALGVYEVTIKLHADIETSIKVWVVKE